jgi:predicted Zn finger-like uncharacterized protein
MVLICTKCEARLQLDEAKTPTRPFTVRCPKCQTSVTVQPASAIVPEGEIAVAEEPAPLRSPFERPTKAPRFTLAPEETEAVAVGQGGSMPGLNDLAKLLADAMRQSDGVAVKGRERIRPAWDRRKILVCVSPAYREVIARPLAAEAYDVFVAESMAQGLGRMR